MWSAFLPFCAGVEKLSASCAKPRPERCRGCGKVAEKACSQGATLWGTCGQLEAALWTETQYPVEFVPRKCGKAWRFCGNGVGKVALRVPNPVGNGGSAVDLLWMTVA